MKRAQWLHTSRAGWDGHAGPVHLEEASAHLLPRALSPQSCLSWASLRISLGSQLDPSWCPPWVHAPRSGQGDPFFQMQSGPVTPLPKRLHHTRSQSKVPPGSMPSCHHLSPAAPSDCLLPGPQRNRAAPAPPRANSALRQALLQVRRHSPGTLSSTAGNRLQLISWLVVLSTLTSNGHLVDVFP